MPSTIRDVAKRLNLSITTVSRALDGYEDVALETRKLVTETAREMGYAPNRAARQLRRQRAETIGFILPAGVHRFDEPFFTQFISGLGDALAEKNYDLLIASSKTDQQEHDLYQRWINSRKVDGFVLNRIQRKDWRIQMLGAADFAFTALGRSQDSVDYPCISVDGSQAYLQLIRHLVEHGFARFAFIGGPANLINHIDRLRWFKSALKKFEVTLDSGHIVFTDMTNKGGYEAAAHLLALPSPPNAILCVNDETAFGALRAANERGLKIGDEIAVSGFEGVEASQYSSPPLTTLDIPIYDIAQQLSRMLLATINGEKLAKRQVTIQPKLSIRKSTGT